MTDKIDEKARAVVDAFDEFRNTDPAKVVAAVNELRDVLAAKQTSPSTSSAPSAEVGLPNENRLHPLRGEFEKLMDGRFGGDYCLSSRYDGGGDSFRYLYPDVARAWEIFKAGSTSKPAWSPSLAAPPSSAAKPECAMCSGRGIIGGWSGGVEGGYDHQDCPECAAGDGGEAVNDGSVGFTRKQWVHHAARVYRACGDTEAEAESLAEALADEQDWHGELDEPFEMALADIESRPTPSAASAPDWCDANDATTAEALRKLLRREPTLAEVTAIQKAVCSAASARVPVSWVIVSDNGIDVLSLACQSARPGSDARWQSLYFDGGITAPPASQETKHG